MKWILPKAKNPQYPEHPGYDFIRIRIVGLLEILEGLMKLVFGHYAPAIVINFLFWELHWRADRHERKKNDVRN